MDTNKQKILMLQLLKDIFSDALLSSVLAIKGGSAAMFFYDLPRFSSNLDFNLLDARREDEVYERVRKIVRKYEKQHDESVQPHGIIILLDYGSRERKLKIEISKRQYNNHYEMRNYLGIQMRVLSKEDLFAHKLCALLNKDETSSRDVFDSWFYLKECTSLSKEIVETRMEMPVTVYLDKCIECIQDISDSSLIRDMIKMDEESYRSFVRQDLKEELIYLLSMFKARPSYQ